MRSIAPSPPPVNLPEVIQEPTWQQLCQAEPRLLLVMAEATRLRFRRKRNANPWPDYERLKNQLSRLVGFFAQQPVLRSCDAYEIAIAKLTDALEV